MQILKNNLFLWLRAARAFSFTASLVPVFVAVSLIIYYNYKANWLLLPLVIICSILFHAGTNLTNDYFDFQKGLDKNNSFGSSHVLTDGLLKPKQVLIAALVSFVGGLLLGLVLVVVRGWPMLIIGIAGLAGGYFYSGKPFAYKYIGLGDIFVFLLMGPLMVIGSFFALTGNFDNRVFYVSLPIGFLVAAILNSNNIRDMAYDSQINIKTLAFYLGEKGSKLEYISLLTSAYLIILIMIFKHVLPLWSFLVFCSLPSALENILKIKNSRKENNKSLALIDVQTAQLQSQFGLLLTISLIIAKYF